MRPPLMRGSVRLQRRHLRVTAMRRVRLALPLAFLLFLADCTTKELAVEHLVPEHVAHPVIGDLLQFTLAYNNVAAMSIPLGPYGRWLLVSVGTVVVIVLLRAAFTGPRGRSAQQVAVGLLLGGALGNLTSRILSERGVVDFIDIGIGTRRFYIFNLADVAITAGVVVWAYALHRAPPRASPDVAT